jgi:hypothetical protein
LIQRYTSPESTLSKKRTRTKSTTRPERERISLQVQRGELQVSLPESHSENSELNDGREKSRNESDGKRSRKRGYDIANNNSCKT